MLPIPRHLWTIENFNRLADKFICHRRVIAILIICLTALSLLGAQRLRVDSNYMAFLPDSFPGVLNLKKVIEKTGGFGNFMVVIEGATPEVRRNYAAQLSDWVQTLDWVDYADFKKNREKIEKSKLLFLSSQDLGEIKARIEHFINFKKNPGTISFFNTGEIDPSILDFSDIEKKYQQIAFGSDYFEDAELKYTVVIVWPKGSMTDLGFSRRAYAELQNVIKQHDPKFYHQGMRVEVGGEYRNKIDEYDSLIQNVLGSTTLTFILIVVLLFLYFRRFGAIFYTLLPLFVGTIWTAGAAWLLVGRLNLLTVFLVTILFGMGIDYGIYLFSGYINLRVQGKKQNEAIALIWHGLGKTILAAAWTTALAFLVLIFTDFKGFQEFGLLAFCGVVLILASYVVMAPLLWIFAEKYNWLHPDRQKSRFMWPRFRYKSVFLWLGFSLVTLALCYLPKIDYEYDYANLRSINNSYWHINTKLHAVFPLSKTPAIVLADNVADAKELVATLRNKLPHLHTVDTVKSIVDFMPDHTNEKLGMIHDIKILIQNNTKFMSEEDAQKLKAYEAYLDPPQFNLSDLPKSVLRQFMGLNNTQGVLVFIYDKVRLSDVKNILRYADEIREIKVGEKVYHPAEGSLLFADTLMLMKQESLMAFVFMLAIVFLNLFFEYKNLKIATIIFLPLIMAFILTIGLMPLFGLKINIFNMVIFPILIGMGDDACLHLYHGLSSVSNSSQIEEKMSQIGSPIFLALITTITGFGSMLLADHQGLQSLAMVACLGLLSIGFMNLVVAPAVYRLFFKK